MRFPNNPLITKDGKIDETVIFDGVELNEEQRQLVESRRSKRRQEFAKSLRSSLEKQILGSKVFSMKQLVARPMTDKDVKPGRKGQDSDDESDDDEGESKSKGDLLTRVASQRRRKAALARAKRNERNDND